MSEIDDIATPPGGEPAQADASATGEAPERPAMDLGQLKAVVEALVFASPEPLTPKMLFKLLADEPREEVTAAVEALKQDYGARPGLQLAEVAGGYQITTRPELHEWVRRLFHERTTQKLSVASLETLSVIAYRQPITRADVEAIRGVQCSEMMKQLMDRGLVRIAGEDESLGRPFLYETTRRFLELFGLRDLDDLPLANRLRCPGGRAAPAPHASASAAPDAPEAAPAASGEPAVR